MSNYKITLCQNLVYDSLAFKVFQLKTSAIDNYTNVLYVSKTKAEFLGFYLLFILLNSVPALCNAVNCSWLCQVTEKNRCKYSYENRTVAFLPE